MRISLIVMVAALSCGKDEENGGASTCDLRSVRGSCIEWTGANPQTERNQEEGCTDAGGTTSSDGCPDTADRIGCCTYELGLNFNECWYTGTTVADPQAACASVDGAYTPD